MITKKINGGNFEPVVTGEIVLDAVPTEGSLNAVTSDGVAQAIAEGGGGSSYTAGDGIVISEGEISAKVDGTTIQVNADGELEAIGGGGGGSYTAGDGIAISGQNEISALVNTDTLSLLAQEIRSSGMGGGIISLTDMRGLSASTTVSKFEYRFTPSPYGSNPYYKLTYDSSTQEGLRVRLQVGSDSSFTKYATSKEDFRVRDSSYNTSFLVLGTNSQGTDTLTLLNMGSLSLANLFDFVGGDSFDDIFSGSSVYVRFVAWDTANSTVVGSPLNMITANGSGYFYLVTSANAKKITVNLPVPRLSGTSGGEVLTVGAGGSGIEWASPSGGGGSYTAIFGSSTYADVLAAFQAGKVIYAAFSDGSVTAPLVEFEPNGQDPVDCKFTFNSVKIDQAGRQSVFVYTLYLDSTDRWDVVNKTL